jgi:hypothetical protein
MRRVVTGNPTDGPSVIVSARWWRATRAPIALVAIVVAVAAVVGACQPPPPPPPPKPPVLEAACAHTLTASTVGSIASNALSETSGIAASRRVSGVWWVHNDSADGARVFAIGNDGRDLGEFDLAGAAAVDWEDIAVGPGPVAGAPSLYLADIGDNAKSRSSVQVYRVAEPLVDPTAAPGPPQTLSGVATLNLTYPDGPHDAEALLIDPITGDLFVVTKDLVGGVAQVFRAPANLGGGSTTTLTQVATVSLGPGQGVTGADVTPAGDVVALRTYLSVVLYPRPTGQPLAQAFSEASCAGSAPPFGTATPASEPQGEAIGFTRDGRGYVTVSEGAHAALHQFLAP